MKLGGYNIELDKSKCMEDEAEPRSDAEEQEGIDAGAEAEAEAEERRLRLAARLLHELASDRGFINEKARSEPADAARFGECASLVLEATIARFQAAPAAPGQVCEEV